MAQCEAGWSTASCAKCAGHGQVAGSDGFVACAECGGSGKTSAPSCCARHDHPDDAHRGEVAYESVAELIKVLDLEDSEGNPVKASDVFEGKVVGLYFSAMHCPACQRFSRSWPRSPTRNPRITSPSSSPATPTRRRSRIPPRARRMLRGTLPLPHRQMLMSAFRIFAIPALHVWHPAMAKAVTGWDTPPSRTTPTSACGTGTGGNRGTACWEVYSGWVNCRSARPRACDPRASSNRDVARYVASNIHPEMLVLVLVHFFRSLRKLAPRAKQTRPGDASSTRPSRRVALVPSKSLPRRTPARRPWEENVRAVRRSAAAPRRRRRPRRRRG